MHSLLIIKLATNELLQYQLQISIFILNTHFSYLNSMATLINNSIPEAVSPSKILITSLTSACVRTMIISEEATQMTNLEAIKIRKSTRTFSDKSMDSNTLNIIKSIANGTDITGPFGHVSQFYYVPIDKKNISQTGEKIGTYGFIKNQQGYVVGITEDTLDAWVDFAYSMEQIILDLTKIQIGTCWLAGTFQRQNLTKHIDINEGQIIPAITPVGYINDKPRLKERILRNLAKADQRKPWDSLFFEGDFTKLLTKESAKGLSTAFEMVRLGPSASNKQSWRLVLDENNIHFYNEVSATTYKNDKLSKIQALDMGIAMYHFEVAVKEQGKDGKFVKADPKLNSPEYYTYFATFMVNASA